jgi:hypothetical protein
MHLFEHGYCRELCQKRDMKLMLKLRNLFSIILEVFAEFV